jgi:hypothetical protein
MKRRNKMANWCSNKITITGPEQSINSIIELAVKHDVMRPYGALPYYFDLEMLHPCPFTDGEDTEGCFTDEQRDWYVANWGTSAVMDAEETERKEVKYIFQLWSKWTPPLRAFAKIAKDHLDLRFDIDYWGYGSGFCGTMVFADGECIKDQMFDHDEYDNLFKDSVSVVVQQGKPVASDGAVALAPIVGSSSPRVGSPNFL